VAPSTRSAGAVIISAVHRRRPTYCVPALGTTLAVVAGLVTAVAAAGAGQRGQQGERPREQAPRETRGASAIALLPAEIGWDVSLPTAPTARAAFDERFVFVPVEGQLLALDWRNGDIRWTAPATTTLSPAVSAGTVVVAEADALAGFTADTGMARWRVTGSFTAIWPADGLLIAVAAAQAAPQAAAQAEPAALVISGRRPDDGQAVWTQTLVADGPLAGIAVDASGVYLTFEPGRVVALARGTGMEMWSRMLPGTLSAPALARDRVFVGSTDNNFYALDASDGSRLWRVRTGGDVVGAVSDGQLVFVAALDNVLRALNRSNGHQRWKQSLPTRPVAPPLAAGGGVLVPGIAPPLAAFNGITGTPAGVYAPPGEVALQGQPLLRKTLEPFQVGMALLRSGRVIGLRPVELMYREAPPAPIIALPGRALTRDALRVPAAVAPADPPPPASQSTIP
jgi:outer membrane protein assembly factor BamB